MNERLRAKIDNFHLIVKLTFLVSKGLLYLCGKQNNTWLLVDMKFLFSCSTRVKHSKRNSISTCADVLFSIYHAMKSKYRAMNGKIVGTHVTDCHARSFCGRDDNGCNSRGGMLGGQ